MPNLRIKLGNLSLSTWIAGLAMIPVSLVGSAILFSTSLAQSAIGAVETSSLKYAPYSASLEILSNRAIITI
jgi:hypothetical protein